MTVHPSPKRMRPWIWLAGATVLIFAVLTGGSVTAYGFWSSPTFCHSCHIMDPYYESWQHSSHGDVACVKCHFEPGLENELRGKWVAVKQLASWATGAYSSMPYAEVSDASCMTSGCHTTEELSQPVAFSDRHIDFDHSSHLGELRRGIVLACTSCHATRSRDVHMELDQAACFLCHFKGAEQNGKNMGACDTCHGPPEEMHEVAGLTVDHLDFQQRGMACDQCHVELHVGTGRVGLERCQSCHNEPEKIDKIDQIGLLHVEHVTVRKKHCYECHDLIDHSLGSQPSTAGDCASCHSSGHFAQSQLLAGVGAVGVPSLPSPKHHLGVDCGACHGTTGGRDPHGGFGSASGSCSTCHDRQYDEFARQVAANLDEMLVHLETRMGSVHEKIDQVRAENGFLERDVYRQLISAEQNLGQLREAGPIHNPLYSVEILRSGLQLMEGLEDGLEIDFDGDYPLGFEVEDCGICHDNLPEPGELVLDGDRKYPHPVHLAETGMDCADCHIGESHPPSAPTNESSCQSCHKQ